jgi:hypothetical protein
MNSALKAREMPLAAFAMNKAVIGFKQHGAMFLMRHAPDDVTTKSKPCSTLPLITDSMTASRAKMQDLGGIAKDLQYKVYPYNLP